MSRRILKAKKPKKRPQIPVTILTGFLGSGKTTLLNHILSSNDHGMRFAIIENELGAISIDDKVLVAPKEQNLGEDHIVEVMNGCICCKLRGDLVDTLNRLYEKVESFDGLIIETTGLADPAPVVQIFFVDHHLMNMYRLDAVITVVDALHIRQRLAVKHKEEVVINESAAQLAFADKILLNKTDLVGNDKTIQDIESKIRAINSMAPILRTQYSKVHPKELLNVSAFSLDRVLELDPDFLDDLHETKHDSAISSVALKFEGELNNQLLQNWIRRVISGKMISEANKDKHNGIEVQLTKTPQQDHTHNGHNHHDHNHDDCDLDYDHQNSDDAMQLFRYKGVFAIKGVEEKLVLQGVNMIFDVKYSPNKWQKDEVRESCMIFIGRNLLSTQEFKKGFEQCKVSQELRFDVGDVVLVHIQQKWEKGLIRLTWDEGNAYRIHLISRNADIWVPVDTESIVRSLVTIL